MQAEMQKSGTITQINADSDANTDDSNTDANKSGKAAQKQTLPPKRTAL